MLNPRANARASVDAAGFVKHQAGLLFAMTARDLKDRYAGQALGAIWAIVTPLLTMAVYVFVFTFIFKGRLGDTSGTAGFTGFVLSGLAPWMALQECMARSTAAISGNSNLVKQIVFPSEVLPLKTALATLPILFIGIVIAAVIAISAGQATITGYILLLPLSVVSFVLFASGVAFLLAAIGVFFKDIKDIVTFFLSVGLFIHPILYPPGGAPTWLQPVFNYSPVSHMIRCFHDALSGGADPHPTSWVIFPVISLVTFLFGWRVFRWLKPTFGNAL